MFDLKDKALNLALGVALAVSVGGWTYTAINLRGKLRTVTIERDLFDKQINDPVGGYVVRLTTCKANTRVLTGGIDKQNAATATSAAKAVAAKARAEAAVATAQVQSGKARREAADVLGTEPKGATACERVDDIDRRLMESLK